MFGNNVNLSTKGDTEFQEAIDIKDVIEDVAEAVTSAWEDFKTTHHISEENFIDNTLFPPERVKKIKDAILSIPNQLNAIIKPNLDVEDAWGYHNMHDSTHQGLIAQMTPERTATKKQAHLFVNVTNALSIVLSPLIGLIKVIYAVVMAIKLNAMDPKDNFDLEGEKRFYAMLAGRGCLEILCLGPILGTVIDGAISTNRYKA